MSRFDQACVLLEKMHPQLLSDCSYNLCENRSIRDLEISKTQRTKIERSFSWMESDRQFCHLANSNLDRLIDINFENAADFSAAEKDFSRRCEYLVNTKVHSRNRFRNILISYANRILRKK